VSSTPDTDVLVLGAGPVGLLAAIQLSERGLRVRIVDKYTRTALRSYALALHARSLRLLDEFGLGRTLDDHGHRLEELEIHHPDGAARIDLTHVGGSYPYLLVLPQNLLEGALEQRLADNGVRVEWGHQVLNFDAGADGVHTLLIETPGDDEASSDPPATERVHSIFLVGADGGDSLTRRLLGVETAGTAPATLGLLEFERAIETPSRLHVTLNPDTVDVMWPLSSGRGRWSVELGGPVADDVLPWIKQTVAERSPWFGGEFGAVEWVTTVDFERRLAARSGRGPVWMIGDAMHFTSPIGVQSMNIGMREAQDLSRRIADILQDGGSPKLLDYYNEDRQREWKMMLGIKERLEEKGTPPGWARAAGQRLVECLPASGRDLNLLLEQVGLRLNWMRGQARGSGARPL
jgi:NADPH-dependent dioxygenase